MASGGFCECSQSSSFISDNDGDGRLTADEFVGIPKGELVDKRWEESEKEYLQQRRKEFKELIDLDGDGFVNFKELVQYTNPRNSQHAKREVRELIELADSNGCKASSRVLVRVQRPRQVYIPNVFKPGSSSLNDLLTVYGGRGVAEIESFRIFDRWGDQLFESLNFQPNDPIIGWDGTHRGDMVLPGVYVYFAVVRFIDGEVELYKGDVTVVR